MGAAKLNTPVVLIKERGAQGASSKFTLKSNQLWPTPTCTLLLSTSPLPADYNSYLVKERQMLGSRAYEEEVREQREVKEWERQKRNGAEEGPCSKEAGKRQAGNLKVG